MTEKQDVKEAKVPKELFPNGPTYDDLREWTKESEVYAIEFGEGNTFFYRPITRGEFKELNVDPSVDVFAREERLCELVTIWPAGYDFADSLGGIASALAEDIMAKSGFAATVEAINAKDILENE